MLFYYIIRFLISYIDIGELSDWVYLDQPTDQTCFTNYYSLQDEYPKCFILIVPNNIMEDYVAYAEGTNDSFKITNSSNTTGYFYKFIEAI